MGLLDFLKNAISSDPKPTLAERQLKVVDLIKDETISFLEEKLDSIDIDDPLFRAEYLGIEFNDVLKGRNVEEDLRFSFQIGFAAGLGMYVFKRMLSETAYAVLTENVSPEMLAFWRDDAKCPGFRFNHNMSPFDFWGAFLEPYDAQWEFFKNADLWVTSVFKNSPGFQKSTPYYLGGSHLDGNRRFYEMLQNIARHDASNRDDDLEDTWNLWGAYSFYFADRENILYWCLAHNVLPYTIDMSVFDNDYRARVEGFRAIWDIDMNLLETGETAARPYVFFKSNGELILDKAIIEAKLESWRREHN